MYAERHVVDVTTDGDGAAEVYTPHVTGRVLSIQYLKTDFIDGVDFTITGEESGQTIWTEANVNAAKTVAPRQATHSTAGVAALYAAGGAAVLDYVVVANERIKVVIAAGGATKVGQFVILVG